MIINPSRQFAGSDLLGANGLSDAALRPYLDQLDWGPGNRDQSAWKAFLRAGSLGINPEVAVKEVANRIKAAGGTFAPVKLQSQLRRAYAHVDNEAGEFRALVRPPKVEFSPDKLRRLALATPEVNEAWLASRSPLNPAAMTGAQFLEALYGVGEWIVAFTDFQSQGQCLFEVGVSTLAALPSRGDSGVWFLANPVDGHFHPNPRQENKLSRRSEESITSWRYLVLENDTADSHEWLACLAQLPLKITAIYTSGGKSIHALVRLDATSKAEWDAQRDRIKPVVVILGADPNALTAVRLTRLPGTLRGDRPQRLLYLNPEPDGTPIISSSKPSHA